MTRSQPAAAAAKPETVYFFGTCLIDLFFPSAGLAGMELLRDQGIKVIYPQGQSCCGQSARNSGYKEEALAVARQQVRAFPKNYPVVVPSGSCAGMMRTHYPDMFKGEPDEAEALDFASRVYELTWFLVHVCKVKLEDRGLPVTVTWHGSCHSQREMGVRTEPKELLRSLANVDLVEIAREQECCGFGGTFSVRQPEISAAMVGDKTADIRRTGASRVVSGDCGCLMNIGGALEKQGAKVKSQHIAEFLLERTRHDR
jgi:L-lactate dehydrogenase complex protein LldE